MMNQKIVVNFLDRLVLFGVQPVLAALALTGLAVRSPAADEVTQPLFVWGGVAMLGVIFAEGVWSFATRHSKRERLVTLWAKLLGAGVCAILAFASAYRHLGMIDCGVATHSATSALYLSITAWSTAGFGDVVAAPAARPFAAAQTLLGFGYNSALIGLLIFSITNSLSANGERR